ncbi:MAG TPA: hypothetical protein VGI92_02410 [Gemmatimonadales bacterium]
MARDNIDWFIALNIGATMLTLWLVYRVMARLWSWWAGLLVLLLLATNAYLVDRAGQIASEPLFMLCSVAAVALLAGEGDTGSRRRIAAGALAIAAAMTRSVGVALVIAVGLQWLMERRWKTVAIFGVVSLATVGAWLLWTIHAPSQIGGESYIGDAVVSITTSHSGLVATMIARVTNHLVDFGAQMLPLVLSAPSIPGTLIDNVLGTTILGVATIAGLWAFWRSWRAASIYLLTTVGVLVAWPFMLTRFAIPLIPLLAASLIAGMIALLRRPSATWRGAILAILVLVLAATGTVRSAALVAHRQGCERGASPPGPACTAPDKASALAAAVWIGSHLPADAVVVYAKPETLAWYSNRKALPVRLQLARDSTMVAQAEAAGAHWLLLSSVQAIETGPLLKRLHDECGDLVVEATFPPRTWLFRLRDRPAADSSGCRAIAEYQRLNRGRNFDTDN